MKNTFSDYQSREESLRKVKILLKTPRFFVCKNMQNVSDGNQMCWELIIILKTVKRKLFLFGLYNLIKSNGR